MSRDLAKRLVRLEARRGDALERMSDAELAAAITAADAKLKAAVGDGWEVVYRDYLAKQAPHLLQTWEERGEALLQLETMT